MTFLTMRGGQDDTSPKAPGAGTHDPDDTSPKAPGAGTHDPDETDAETSGAGTHGDGTHGTKGVPWATVKPGARTPEMPPAQRSDPNSPLQRQRAAQGETFLKEVPAQPAQPAQDTKKGGGRKSRKRRRSSKRRRSGKKRRKSGKRRRTKRR